MQKTAYNSEMVRDTAKDKCTATKRRLQISPVRNVGRVFELSGVVFRLIPPYGGLLVTISDCFGLNTTVYRAQAQQVDENME